MRSFAVVVAALFVVSAAAAKGPMAASVCGASGCRAGDPGLLNPLDGRPYSLAATPRPAPYYVAFLSSLGERSFCWRLVWVPSRRLLRVENLGTYVPGDPVAGRTWRTVDRPLARRLNRGFRGVTPFAPTRTWRAPKSRCAV